MSDEPNTDEEFVRVQLERRARVSEGQPTGPGADEAIRRAVRARITTEPQQHWPLAWLERSFSGLRSGGSVAGLATVVLIVLFAGGAVLLAGGLRGGPVGSAGPTPTSATSTGPSASAAGAIDPMTRALTVSELIRANSDPTLNGTTVIVHGALARQGSAPAGSIAITDGAQVAQLRPPDGYCPTLETCPTESPVTLAVTLAGDGSDPQMIGALVSTEAPGLTVEALLQQGATASFASSDSLYLVHGWIDSGLALPCPAPPPGDQRFVCGIGTWLTADPFQSGAGPANVPSRGIRAQNGVYADFATQPGAPDGGPPREGTFLVRWATCPPQGCSLMPDTPANSIPVEILERVDPVTIPTTVISSPSTGPLEEPAPTPGGPAWDPATRPLSTGELSALAALHANGLLYYQNQLFTVYGQLLFMGQGGCLSGPCLAAGFTFSGVSRIAVDGIGSTALADAPGTFVVRATDTNRVTLLGELDVPSGALSAWDVPGAIARMHSHPAGLRLVDGWIVPGSMEFCALASSQACGPAAALASSASPGPALNSQIALTEDTGPLPQGHGIYVVQGDPGAVCPVCADYAGTDELLGQVQPMTIPPPPGPPSLMVDGSQIFSTLDAPEDEPGAPLVVAACRSVDQCLPHQVAPPEDAQTEPKPSAGDQILVEIVGASADTAFWDDPGTTVHVVIEGRSGGYQADLIRFAPAGPITVSFDLVDAAGRPISSTVIRLP